jgi:hypothetical protein
MGRAILMIIVKTKHVYGILAVSKYAGPTNTKGARCIVSIRKKRFIIDWDHSLNSEEMHEKAIKIAFDYI